MWNAYISQKSMNYRIVSRFHFHLIRWKTSQWREEKRRERRGIKCQKSELVAEGEGIGLWKKEGVCVGSFEGGGVLP